MSEIEIHIDDEDSGGDVWLTIDSGVLRDRDGNLHPPGGVCFTILDADAADLLRDILDTRRPGTYNFGPLDVNG